jgi:hypothetical protein
MSKRLPIGIAILSITIVASGLSAAKAWPNSRLTALAAREDLSDEVCVAMALDNGHLTPEKRLMILYDAHKILDPKEFEAFHRALDRISPPPPPPPKKPAAKRPNQVAQQKSSSLTRLQAMRLSSRTSAGPVMTADVAQPDRMASRGVLR